MKRILSMMTALCVLLCCCAAAHAEEAYVPGTYTGHAQGMQPMTVEVEFSGDAILSVTITENGDENTFTDSAAIGSSTRMETYSRPTPSDRFDAVKYSHLVLPNVLVSPDICSTS